MFAMSEKIDWDEKNAKNAEAAQLRLQRVLALNIAPIVSVKAAPEPKEEGEKVVEKEVE